MATEMTEFYGSPFVMVHCGITLVVPVIVGTIINIGCGKKRDKPIRPAAPPPGDDKSKRHLPSKNVAVSAAGTSSKSSKKVSNKANKPAGKSIKSLTSKKWFKPSKIKKSKRESASESLKSIQESSCARDPKTGKPQRGQTPVADKCCIKAPGIFDSMPKSDVTQKSSSKKSIRSSNEPLNAVTNVRTGDSSTHHQFKMEPSELRWNATGGLQKISLINQSNQRKAIKVKCSNNNVYKVNPVYAFVEPGETLNVDVLRSNGTNKVDKIIFVSTKAEFNDNKPKDLFKLDTPSTQIILPLLASDAFKPVNPLLAKDATKHAIAPIK